MNLMELFTNNDKDSQNNKEQRFVNDWQKNLGILGFLRYVTKYLLLGVILSPIVLSILNPNIWNLISQNGWARSWISVLFMAALFAIVPTFFIGIAIWRRNHQKYKQLTTGKDRYLPLEKRQWLESEKKWKIAISILNLLMAISLVMGFGLMLGHNSPKEYAYLFEATLLYFVLLFTHEIYQTLYSKFNDGLLKIPVLFKFLLITCSLIVSLLWLVVLFQDR